MSGETGSFRPYAAFSLIFLFHDAFPLMLVLPTVEGSLGLRNNTTTVKHSLFQTYRFFPQGCDDDMQGGTTCSHFVSLLLLPLLCTTNISKPPKPISHFLSWRYDRVTSPRIHAQGSIAFEITRVWVRPNALIFWVHGFVDLSS